MVFGSPWDMRDVQLGINPESLSREQQYAADMLRMELLHQFKLVTEENFALMLGVTTVTLQIWRSNNRGPAYIKLGRAVFYRKEDIRVWINANVVTPQNPQIPPQA